MLSITKVESSVVSQTQTTACGMLLEVQSQLQAASSEGSVLGLLNNRENQPCCGFEFVAAVHSQPTRAMVLCPRQI